MTDQSGPLQRFCHFFFLLQLVQKSAESRSDEAETKTTQEQTGSVPPNTITVGAKAVSLRHPAPVRTHNSQELWEKVTN